MRIWTLKIGEIAEQKNANGQRLPEIAELKNAKCGHHLRNAEIKNANVEENSHVLIPQKILSLKVLLSLFLAMLL